MPLGWIDFSKSDQARALDVLNHLKDEGTLDELGIAPIRDGFSDTFFPGISTIQTRAKYFIIVPYALKDLELSDETSPAQIRKELDEIERDCARKLIAQATNKQDTAGQVTTETSGTGQNVAKQDAPRQSATGTGVIGQDPDGSWVKRTAATVYWAGLRQFGIFTKDMSLDEYIRVSCGTKKEKQNARRQGKTEESDSNPGVDDLDAGAVPYSQFWCLPGYERGDYKKGIKEYGGWLGKLQMELTRTEAEFLRERILATHKDSMLAFFLKGEGENLQKALEGNVKFDEFGSVAFPGKMREDYQLAVQFARFYEVIAAVFNLKISDGRQKDAVSTWNRFLENPDWWTQVDLDKLFLRIPYCNKPLRDFLYDSKKLLLDKKLECMKDRVRQREETLKGASRAKTCHPELYDPNHWHGIGKLEYRFTNAKRILNDIVKGLGTDVESTE